MNTAKKLVLFFIDGPTPTDHDRQDVDTIVAENPRFNVVFRNAQSVNPAEAVEAADFVAGKIPANYEKIERLKFKAVARTKEDKEPPKTK